ncbi:hypothetical protein [Nesterenkonia rhizosphaerae]|uniref:hypothetical protein n=1 Tax=Nesterenkonia rhizosphaerae TaxID=1348272 RepID=UPI0031E5ECF4
MEQELRRREQCGYLKEQLPTLDEEFISGLTVSPDYVPHEGSLQVLQPLADLHGGGGLSIDVLEVVAPGLLDLSVNAMWAFPGLSATAVDIITPSLDSADEAVVLDVDPGADLSEFIYPAYGRERRVGVAILDQMLSQRP